MLVTVVIPSFNVAAYIGDALQSVLVQDYAQVEIIVVDNGSTDNTVEQVKKLQEKYPRRIKLLHEKRRGAPYARNRGLQESSGEWIQFLDADDYLLPEKLSRQTQLTNPITAVIIGTPVYEDLQGKQTPLIPWADHWKGLAHGMYCGQTSANLYQRKALNSIGAWNEKLPDTQDAELMFRLLSSGFVRQIDDKPSCVCRDRPEGRITQKDPSGILVRHLQLRARINQFLAMNEPSYWLENQTFFLLASYRFLRMLAVQNVDLAASLYSQYIPVNFRLVANKELKIPPWNALLVNYIGIKRTELLKRKLRYFFSDENWGKWKEFIAAK